MLCSQVGPDPGPKLPPGIVVPAVPRPRCVHTTVASAASKPALQAGAHAPSCCKNSTRPDRAPVALAVALFRRTVTAGMRDNRVRVDRA